jgi:WD40 repeat protein
LFIGQFSSITLAQKPQEKNASVNAIAFAPDGKTLVAGLQSGQVVLLDPDSGQEKQRLKGHGGLPVAKVAFNPKGGKIASVGGDTVVRVWNENGEEIQNLRADENPTRTVAYSSDGTKLAHAGEDSILKLWDAESGKLARAFHGHRNFVNDIKFSPDGTALASADLNGQIFLWNIANGERRRAFLGHAGGVTSIDFSPRGDILASAGDDGTVRTWKVEDGSQLQIFKGPTKRVRTVAFSPDGTTVVGGDEDGKLFTWDVNTGKPSGALPVNKNSITSIAFNPADPSTLASADEGGEVVLVDVAKGQGKKTISVAAEGSTQPSQQKSLKIQKNHSPLDKATVNSADKTLIAAIPSPPGGPILVVTNNSNAFSGYYAEILRNEGLNYFNVSDISSVTPATLANYDVVILAQTTLTSGQVTTFSDWVNSGGHLIAMRPDKQLASLLGLTDANSTLSDSYLLVDTSKAPGNGIVNQTIQFHGTADLYNLNGASSLATLYTNATTPTSSNKPAVTLRPVGTNGGKAAAFTYDLARSIVYTRQGNPAWAGQERDGCSPTRSNDIFYGGPNNCNLVTSSDQDWVNLNKVAIPQADEQQRLLVNLIINMNSSKKPLPRFWYFPRGEKAVVLMTGDDHGNGNTVNRFNEFIAESPANCVVDDWKCIRGTSYIYTNINMTDAQAAAFNNNGFEIALHVDTGCSNYTSASLTSNYTTQLGNFSSTFPSLPAPVTQRHHCLVWSDWSTAADVELSKGIRLDTTYYYWPPNWVQDRPGFFTGSGMPMRFAKQDGTIIDVYKAATQMTDESGQSYPYNINTLLDQALGSEGYYGVFNVNAHTDNIFGQVSQTASDEVVASAKARNVPVISARQLLTWLDGRNNSSFGSLAWNSSNRQLSFNITKATGANGLQAMLPTRFSNLVLSSITRNGSSVTYATTTAGTNNTIYYAIKGIEYALFSGDTGSYVATYTVDTTAPQANLAPSNGATNVNVGTNITATFNEAMDAATINTNSFELRDSANALVGASVTYDAATRIAKLEPIANLSANTIYTATLKSTIVRDQAGNGPASNITWSFTTAGAPCSQQQPCTIWDNSATPTNPLTNDPNAVELGVKFRSDIDGYVTGIRFYKGNSNTGTYKANLWNTNGQNLRTTNNNNISASGWRQIDFATPVPITANTTYVASYYTSIGRYAADQNFFAASGVTKAPLSALSNNASGGNGVYRYGSSSGFPNNTYNSSNYWVDVVFTTSTIADTTPPTVTATAPSNSGTGIGTNTKVQATFSEAMNSGTISSSTFELRNPSNIVVAAQIAYDTTSNTATLTPNAALAANTTYTATIKGGSNGVKDQAGNSLAQDYSWSFTTGSGMTIWDNTATPSVLDPDTNATEVGVKFRSDVNGFVKGVRFYKGNNSTTNYTVNLWNNSTQQSLANATINNVSGIGWKEVTFSSPVAITANTVYIASYHTSIGNYSTNEDYFTNSGVDRPPLHALQNGVSGDNGVYRYSSTPAFPNSGFNSTNYWVDVVFSTTNP